MPGISSASTGIFYVTPGASPTQIYAATSVRGLALLPDAVTNPALYGLAFGSAWLGGSTSIATDVYVQRGAYCRVTEWMCFVVLRLSYYVTTAQFNLLPLS